MQADPGLDAAPILGDQFLEGGRFLQPVGKQYAENDAVHEDLLNKSIPSISLVAKEFAEISQNLLSKRASKWASNMGDEKLVDSG